MNGNIGKRWHKVTQRDPQATHEQEMAEMEIIQVSFDCWLNLA